MVRFWVRLSCAGIFLTLAPAVVLAETQEGAWNRLNAETRGLREAQQFDAALAKAEEAFSIAEKRFGKQHFKTAQSLRELSDLRFLKKDHYGADRDLDRARAIWEKELGKNHPFVLSVRRLRAERLASSERWNEAVAEMETVRGIAEEIFGVDHGAVATAYHQIGVWQWAASQKRTAVESFEKELGILEKTESAGSERLRAAYDDLSERYLDAGNVDSATAIQSRGVRFWKKSLGPDHVDLADRWLALADLDATRGEGHLAEEGYLEAIRILEKNPSHPESVKKVAAVYYRLREYYASAGRSADAVRAEQKARDFGGDNSASSAAVS